MGLRNRLLLLAACLATGTALGAIEDIPAGELLWLQGFDGNPPTPGFRVDGTLLLRSVDDTATIGVNLSSGAITNSPIGTILVEVGVAGARFINGSLLNEGAFEASSSLSFNTPDSFIRNTGSFQIQPGSTARLLGRGITFTQAGGVFDAGLTGFEHRDGTFRYEGGVILGEPLIARGTVEVAEAVTSPVTFRLSGPGGYYLGPLGTNVSLKILASPTYGGDTAVVVESPTPLRGTIELNRLGSGGNAALEPDGGRLEVAETGALLARFNGGRNLLRAALDNAGTVEVIGRFTVENPSAPSLNHGQLTLFAGSDTTFTGGFTQNAGSLILAGGILSAEGGLTLAGGDVSLAGELRGAVTNRVALTLTQADEPFRVTGSLAHEATGALTLQLADGRSGVPLLDVTGPVLAAGALRVEFDPGFTPVNGDEFTLLQAGQFSGDFAPFSLPALPAGLFWRLERTPGQLLLQVADTPAPPELRLVEGVSGTILQLQALPAPRAVIQRSLDLAVWETLLEVAPFSGNAVVTNPLPSAGTPAFFRAELE